MKCWKCGNELTTGDASILFAGIDTIFKRWGDLRPFDVLIIDEAHRIPASGEGRP